MQDGDLSVKELVCRDYGCFTVALKASDCWLLFFSSIFTLKVGTVIITSSYLDVDFPTRFSIKHNFFAPLRSKSERIILS